jgi:SMODS and SLOG-associating 2TM effector domain 3/SMODS and SLOG-associating 2TM effector domain 1
MAQSPHLPQFHVVGFTGHRRLEDGPGVAAVIREVIAALRREAPGEWIGLSSAAAGSDALFAREVLAQGCAWQVVLPLGLAEFKRDFDEDEWAEAEALLAAAEQVRILNESGVREDAFLDAGMETVHDADIVLAVWDGEPARGKGGTADVIAYARDLGRPLIIIEAQTLAVRRENWSAFAAHDHDLAYFNGLPPAPASAEGAANPFGAPDEILSFQRKVDHVASRGAPQFRRLIASTTVLHVAATLIAAAGLAFALESPVLPWMKLTCLAGALGVALLLRKQGAHHHWVRCRLAAEFCRSALATWGLPRGALLFADLDLPGLRLLARALQVLHRRAAGAEPVSMDEFKRLYLAHRVDDQLEYYERRLAKALPQLVWLRAGFWCSTLAAITCTAAYALHRIWSFAGIPPAAEAWFFHFLPISLPVVAAAFISLISINDLHRRVARYREMQAILRAARKQIAYSRTWSSLERVVERTERALLQEVIEWHSITSFAESH